MNSCKPCVNHISCHLFFDKDTYKHDKKTKVVKVVKKEIKCYNMDTKFAEDSRRIFFLVIFSLILAILVMTSKTTVAIIGRILLLLLLAYIAQLVLQQIATLKETMQKNTSIQQNVLLSYILLVIVGINFLFIMSSLLSVASTNTSTTLIDSFKENP